MKSISGLTFIFSLLFNTVYAQIIFENQIGSEFCYEEAIGVRYMGTDDIFVSASYNCSGGIAGWNSFMLQFDDNGDTIFTEKNTLHNGIIDNSQNGNLFFGGGNSAGFVYDSLRVIKLSSSLTKIWQYDTLLPICNNQITALKATPDGGVVFSAIYSFATCNQPLYNSLLIKLNADGEKEWAYSLEGALNDQIHDIEYVENEGYYLSGWSNSQSGTGIVEVFAAKIDLQGNEVWQNTYGFIENSYAYGITIVEDSGIYITGYTSSVFVVKLDFSGNLSALYPFGNACGGTFMKISHTPDNGLVFLSRVNNNGICRSVFTKTDLSGQVIWQKEWEAVLRDFDYVNDSSFILTGNINHLPDILLIRFDSTTLPGYIPTDTTSVEEHLIDNVYSVSFIKEQHALYIKSDNYHFSNAAIKVFDFQGRQIMSSKIHPDNQFYPLPPNSAVGIYFYQIVTENRPKTESGKLFIY
ncbi:MAG: hypothetical protein EA412_13610 [Chitinophagaceae bacterium]|nr:MAG: hypothetical protein EA412_13610 [Chitinophagaceae bacterium]